MTNDVLNQSIAAALVAADLSFSSMAAKMGTGSYRVFQLEFKVQDGGRIQVAGYVSGNVFIALAPLRVADPEKRRDIASMLASRLPMARLLPHAPEQDDKTIAWVECAVPVPAGGPGGEPVSPWLIVPTLITVASAVDAALSTFGKDASLPAEPTSPPMIVTGSLPVSAGTAPQPPTP